MEAGNSSNNLARQNVPDLAVSDRLDRLKAKQYVRGREDDVPILDPENLYLVTYLMQI